MLTSLREGRNLEPAKVDTPRLYTYILPLKVGGYNSKQCPQIPKRELFSAHGAASFLHNELCFGLLSKIHRMLAPRDVTARTCKIIIGGKINTTQSLEHPLVDFRSSRLIKKTAEYLSTFNSVRMLNDNAVAATIES